MQKAYVANKALLVNSKGKVLILRDAGKGDHANSVTRWDFPGGRMDAGETPLEGLVREIKEEVGVNIDPTQAWPFHVGKWGVGGDVQNEPIIGIYYMVPVGEIDIEISEEHTEFTWIDPKGSLDDDVRASIGDVLEAYIKYATEMGHN